MNDLPKTERAVWPTGRDLRELSRRPRIYCPDGSLNIAETADGISIQRVTVLMLWEHDETLQQWTGTPQFDLPPRWQWVTGGNSVIVPDTQTTSVQIALQLCRTPGMSGDTYLVGLVSSADVSWYRSGQYDVKLYGHLLDAYVDASANIVTSAKAASLADIIWQWGCWAAIPIGFYHGVGGEICFAMDGGAGTWWGAYRGHTLLSQDLTVANAGVLCTSEQLGAAGAVRYLFYDVAGGFQIGTGWPEGISFATDTHIIAGFRHDGAGNIVSITPWHNPWTLREAAYNGDETVDGKTFTIVNGIITGVS